MRELAVTLSALLYVGYAFTTTTLQGKCADTYYTPVGVYTESQYIYVLLTPTDTVTWKDANNKCAMLFNQGLNSQLASYRSQTVQSGIEGAATIHLWIGFGIFGTATSPNWLDSAVTYTKDGILNDIDNSITTFNNVVTYQPELGTYKAFADNDSRNSQYICEVFSKFGVFRESL
jgi:hypothetical protein